MGMAYRCGDCAAGINTGKVGQDLAFTGTAVWAVREDGKRASWELYRRLTAR